jgi:hypothetical protein
MLVGTGTQRAQLHVDIFTCIASVRCRLRVITLLTIWLLLDIESTQHTRTL